MDSQSTQDENAPKITHQANNIYNPFIPNPQQPVRNNSNQNDTQTNSNGTQNNEKPNTNNTDNNTANNQQNQNPNNENKPKEDYNKNKSQYELSIEYENALRQELEKSTPLISEQLDINILNEDYKSNEEYVNSVKTITTKYKKIRKVRRDGNCFYRSFIYRLFEFICMKNNQKLFEHIKKKIEEVKDLTTRNGYDWIIVEDFYNTFLNEFNNCFNSLLICSMTVRDYLDKLFSDKEKGNYLIYFIRFCIAAYLKENFMLYEVYVEGPFQNWIQNEVEAIDHEADQIQIMACVNFFDIGVRIEYLNPYKNEVMKFPEDKKDEDIFITVLFTPGHYDILYV